jgi:hypothetical protein
MMKIEHILWHHGTCDCCKGKNIVVCHFGYDTQPNRDYRICVNCMAENIQVILFGRDSYKDGLIRESVKTRR